MNVTREDDIQKLIEGVLDATPDFYDNPNGGYEYTCPFCLAMLSVGGNVNPTIADLPHELDCIYLIAKDLNTKARTNHAEK